MIGYAIDFDAVSTTVLAHSAWPKQRLSPCPRTLRCQADGKRKKAAMAGERAQNDAHGKAIAARPCLGTGRNQGAGSRLHDQVGDNGHVCGAHIRANRAT
jgi:hypothetical protein